MPNQLYTVTYDLDWLKPAKIVPSKHFLSLSLEDQTAALKSRIETLYEDLKQLREAFMTHDVGMRETVKRRRELITEIELSQQYLDICREHHGGPSTSEKVNGFSSAA